LKRLFRSAGFWFFVLLLVVLLATRFFEPTTKPDKLSYTDFVNQVNQGHVAKVVNYDKDGRIEGQYKTNFNKGGKFTVDYPVRDSETMYNALWKHKVLITNEPQRDTMWLSLVINFLPFVLILAIWIFMLQQMQGGGNKVMSFGKSKAKRLTKDQPRVTFKDVAGVDEAVEELQEIKEFLSNPAKFQALGAKIPKGVLLYGPPGSGKTLLARAVAGEAGVPFFSISGSDFVEMFVGVGASRVRDLFEQAKANSPCIIFMDEIDAVGRHRGAGLGGGHDEREQTLNQLLVEMDGFDIKDNVILIAATNRPDILDPALLRPGRFDRQIVVDRPDIVGRLGILKVHTRGKPLAKDVDVDVLARRTPGFTGADLANLVNEAALLAARHGKKEIDMTELEESIDRVMAGPERKTRLIGEKEKEIIAYHEAGHALVAHSLENTDPVHKISIIPRGRALGYTLQLPTEDKFLVSKSELVDNLAVFLGGHAAEEMIFHDVTTGSNNDLDRATKLARQMVCEYGMSEKLGPMTLGQKEDQVFLGRDFASHPDYSQEIAFEIDKEIRRLIDESFKQAKRILTEKNDTLDNIAKALMELETLEKDELRLILEGKDLPPKPDPDNSTGAPAAEPKKRARKKESIDLPGNLRPAEG
jgi:cell division protease FtsH